MKRHASLIEDDSELDITTKKTKGKKEAKKSTYQETLELWQAKNSLEEIANLRKLTVQTIGNHMAKLIENGSVQINQLLPEDTIAALEKIFEGFNEDTLTPLKEKYGDEFSWNELKMYRAFLNTKAP